MTEQPAGPSAAASVVLELGAGIGALVLYTPASLDGREIEISPRRGQHGGDRKRTHALVRRRETETSETGTSTVYAAVYPQLPAGDYAIWRDDSGQATAATVTGGRVTSCRWPG
jgi:hypothetical protein